METRNVISEIAAKIAKRRQNEGDLSVSHECVDPKEKAKKVQKCVVVTGNLCGEMRVASYAFTNFDDVKADVNRAVETMLKQGCRDISTVIGRKITYPFTYDFMQDEIQAV